MRQKDTSKILQLDSSLDFNGNYKYLGKWSVRSDIIIPVKKWVGLYNEIWSSKEWAILFWEENLVGLFITGMKW